MMIFIRSLVQMAVAHPFLFAYAAFPRGATILTRMARMPGRKSNLGLRHFKENTCCVP
ncbi:hypothetical protein JHW44_05185 [Paracoccus seriniphilus]|nr:hypothetical protein JHW44_05185 [Paracoccus seriniphilus]